MSVRTGSRRYRYRLDLSQSVRGGANGAWPRTRQKWGVRPDKGKLASAPPGAVCAPSDGLGQIEAVTISTRAGSHAHVARYGRRGDPDTRRELDAISNILESRDRVEIVR